MNSLESNTLPFVINIWLEETAEEAGQVIWRGHITHVPSSERRYFEDLEDIIVFIAPYLEEVGVRFDLWWRARRWLKRWKLYLDRRLSRS